MASLQSFKVKGHKYYRLVESKRVNGKPRAVPLLYLGTAESILERFQNAPEIEVCSYEHGSILAIMKILEESGIKEILERRLGKKKLRGVTTAEAFILIIINRLLSPCSKHSFSAWCEQTSLFKFFPQLDLKKFTSQLFWEHMQEIVNIESLEEEIALEVVKRYGIKLETLLFDNTNCFTYLSDGHEDSELCQYGHSKENQTNRRIFGVSLAVTRQDKIPLFHDTYPGNKHDSVIFPKVVDTLVKRLSLLGSCDTTLVFDRGNFSKDNFKYLDQKKLNFVTGLRLNDIPKELFDIPKQQFRKDKRRTGEKDISYYSREVELFGEKRLAVFYLSETAKRGQEKKFNDELGRTLKSLHEWNESLMNQLGEHELSPAKVQKRINAILKAPYLKEFLTISYNQNAAKQKRLQFSVDEKAKSDIIIKYFGKRCLITSRTDWHPLDVIDAYFSQAIVERSFRDLKDDSQIAIRPQFHWTDQSIRVHVFSCFLALLISQLMLKKVEKLNYRSSADLISDLKKIRLANIINKDLNSYWKLEQNKLTELISAFT